MTYNRQSVASTDIKAIDMTISLVPSKDSTLNIQKAIDKCFLHGGGIVTLEKGEYHIKGIRLRSNVNLHLKSGAHLIASRNPDDYYTLANDDIEPMPKGFCKPDLIWTPADKRKDISFITDSGSRWNNAIIRLQDATNASITGEPDSYIDGRNSFDPIGEEHMRGVHGITAFNCKGLHFSGIELRHIGNWAFRIAWSQDLTFKDLTVIAGHDGIHVRGCDRIHIENCILHTGDDAIAGFDNQDVSISKCDLNTACSAFRFGGTRVNIEDCIAHGPGIYPIRHSLPRSILEAGGNGEENTGRRNMLSFFTYFSDFTQSVRQQPGEITIRRCKCKSIDRLIHYNFSGNELWQRNRPLADIKLSEIEAQDVGMSLCAYGDSEIPTTLILENCQITFRTQQTEFLRCAHLKEVRLENITVKGVDGPLIRSWSGDIPYTAEKIDGVQTKIEIESTNFETAPI